MTAATISAPREDARTTRYRQAERVLWEHYGLEPAERFVEVGSPPMQIRVVEVGSGPPVLFAHGTAGNAPAIAALLRDLPGYRCLLFDRPGFGLSSPMRYAANTFGPTVADPQARHPGRAGHRARRGWSGTRSVVPSRSGSRSTIRVGCGESSCWARARWSPRRVASEMRAFLAG